MTFFVSTEPFCSCRLGDVIKSITAKHAAPIQHWALYLNFKNDLGDLLEVTDFSIVATLQPKLLAPASLPHLSHC